MPFPAARECRWLARVLLSQNVCLVFLFPSQPPSTHPSGGAIWSHRLLALAMPRLSFASSGNTAAPRLRCLEYESLAQAWFWCHGPYLSPRFSCQDWEVFSQLFPDFLSSVPRVLHVLQPFHSGFVPGCSADTWILASSSHLLTWMVPRSFPILGL